MNKILQINSVINSGSTGRIAEEIGHKIISLGWESYIAYGRNERPSKSHKIKIGNKFDIGWHVLESRLFDRQALASRSATRDLIKKIETIKPSIVHLHNIHGYYLNIDILFRYLSKYNYPIVWTLHDCWPITGHCTHFMSFNCEKWKSHCEKCPAKKTYPTSVCLDRSYNNYELKRNLFTSVKRMTLVPVSAWLASIISESFLKYAKVQTIYNGVDVNIFAPREKNEVLDKLNLMNKFIILGVSNDWIPSKGLNDFIKLSDLLKEDESIVMIGVNENLKKKLPANIISISRTEDVSQLADLYSLSNVTINPTWEDNFPTINLESLACGTPVITYRTGGSPEAITPDTGFVVNQGDIGGIRKAIDTIKQKGKDEYKKACRKRAVEYFNKDNRFNEYIELYKTILLEQ